MAYSNYAPSAGRYAAYDYDYGGRREGGDYYHPTASDTPPASSSRSSRPRRGSVLANPDSGERPHHRTRSRSKVRLQEPEDSGDGEGESDDGRDGGRYVRHRDGRREFVPDAGRGDRDHVPRRPKYHQRVSDLEAKDAPKHRDFRAKRNGFEAAEGRTHRDIQAKYEGLDDLADDGASRIRAPDPYDDRAAGAASRRSQKPRRSQRPRGEESGPYHDDRGYKSEADPMGYKSEAERGYTSEAPRKSRRARQSMPPDYYDSPRGYPAEPPSRREQPPRAEPPPRRRASPRRSPARPYDEPSRERGRYDAYPPAPQPRSNDSRRHRRGTSVPSAPYPPEDPYGDPRRPSRARSTARREDPYAADPHRRDAAPRRHASVRGPHEAARPPRDAHYPRPRADERQQKGTPEWVKKGGAFVVSTALPIIKQEGKKYIEHEMQKRLARGQ